METRSRPPDTGPMRKLIVNTFITVDGVMRAPGDDGTREAIASTTRETLEWGNSELIEGDLAAAVARLKEADGPELHVHGSHPLIETLAAHDLVDEYRLWIFPALATPAVS